MTEMDGAGIPNLLAEFSAFLSARMGLHYPPQRWGDLERSLRQMAPELGFANAETCMRYFLAVQPSREQIETLASHLTIGETYFFREPRSFEVLAQEILPPLIQARRQAGRNLRIWSVACSTGEEAYSMAILLDQLIPDIAKWHITLLATDINPRSLRRGMDGIYSEWSFRGIDPDVRKRYFTQRNNRYEIAPHIKRMVTFAYHNLAEDQYPSVLNNTNAMDIIFCRNVLMYFSFDTGRRVVSNLHHSLVEGGWLVAAAVEGSSELFSPFVFSGFPGATIYRKLSPPVTTLPVTPLLLVPDPLTATPVSAPAAAHLPPSPSLAPAASPAVPEVPQPPATPPETPMEVQDLFAEACALYIAGRFQEAIALLQAHAAEVATDGRCMGLLARLFANEGRLGEAADWCQRAIAIDKLAPERHYLLAMIRQECGDLREAAQSLKRALFLDPNFVLAHFALARLAITEGKLDEARRHYRNTAALLRGHDPEETLPESDGLTVGRLIEIIRVASAEVGL